MIFNGVRRESRWFNSGKGDFFGKNLKAQLMGGVLMTDITPFNVLGERVTIAQRVDCHPSGLVEVLKFEQGIFQIEEGLHDDRLDFIIPRYDKSERRDYAAVQCDTRRRQRVHPENPILSVHGNVDHSLLKYLGHTGKGHLFHGPLVYAFGIFVSDGNPEAFDIYKSALQAAGFTVK